MTKTISLSKGMRRQLFDVALDRAEVTCPDVAKEMWYFRGAHTPGSLFSDVQQYVDEECYIGEDVTSYGNSLFGKGEEFAYLLSDVYREYGFGRFVDFELPEFSHAFSWQQKKACIRC